MGQVLSSILRCMGLEAKEEERSIELKLLKISLPSSNSISTSYASPRSDSGSDCETPPGSGSDSVSDSETSAVWHRGRLISPVNLNSSIDSSTVGAPQQELLIIAPRIKAWILAGTRGVLRVLFICLWLLIQTFRYLSKELGVKEKWIKHYSSNHRILLVGEGDFSFSACLAVALGSAANMVATSLDSAGILSRNYGSARANIQKLKGSGCRVMHGVDATKMANNHLLKHKTFDRIIFNFPHAGFVPNDSRDSQIRRHQTLVLLFLRNAKKLLAEEGEIHISHKSNGFHRQWNLEQLASSVGLRLVGKEQFRLTDYPGYNTKYGYKGDENFDCNPSKTYKFGL